MVVFELLRIRLIKSYRENEKESVFLCVCVWLKMSGQIYIFQRQIITNPNHFISGHYFELRKMNRLPVRGQVAAVTCYLRVISCDKPAHHLQFTLNRKCDQSYRDNDYLKRHVHSKRGHWLGSLLAFVRPLATDYLQLLHWLTTLKGAATGRMSGSLWVIRSGFSKLDQCGVVVFLTTVAN